MGLQGVLIICCIAAMVAMATSTTCRKFETFNVGLTNAVPNSQTRRPQIVDALRDSPSDFICLQEVWQEKDMKYILDELSEVFPHHYSPIHECKDSLRPPSSSWFRSFSIKDTACSALESVFFSARILPCGVVNGCFSKSGWELGECLATNCAHVLSSDSLSPSCVSCVFMNALNSITEAVNTCSVPGGEHNRMNTPGLLVLSKQDLGTVEYKSFYPDNRMTIERGYIKAELDRGTNVVCTHLSSNVEGYIEYDADFDSYRAQQNYEIRSLNTTFKDLTTVLLGDLNTGPRVTGESNPEKDLVGEFVENYDLLLRTGFVSPYQTTTGLCTYCSLNSLIQNYPNQILDHITVRPSTLSVSGSTRVYDTSNPPISDHYGVRLQVCT